MTKNVSIAEAKARLSDCVREAERGEPIVITRHGKPVAALVASGDLGQLERLRKAGPQSGLASLAGGWEGSDELADRLAESKRGPTRRDKEMEQS